MTKQELKDTNKELRERLNRMETRNKELEAHIEMQRAEIILLRNRNDKSKELKKICGRPGRHRIKQTEIDNRTS